jgi:hypothetical protein
MPALNSKYNFKADVSATIFCAFHSVARAKGLETSVYLKNATKLKALIPHLVDLVLKDPEKVWVTLGDYALHMDKRDYDTVNTIATRTHSQTIDEYLSARVSYW